MSRFVSIARQPGYFMLPGLLLCCGCDLAEYEKREDEERARVTYFDAENKVLGDPLDMPRRKVPVVVTNKLGKPEKKTEPNPVQKIDVFLRPPRQFPSRISKEDENNPFGGILYRYAGRPGSFYNVFLAASTDKKKTIDEFHNEVRQALLQFYQKEYKRAVTFPTKKIVADRREPLKTRREAALPITFQTVSYSDSVKEAGIQFQIFFHKAGNDQVAIVFQTPASDAPTLSAALDYSLKTLDTRAGASNKRRAYLSRSG